MPKAPASIPQNSKFLEGTGESAWFYIENGLSANTFLISRYSIKGTLECKNTFILQTTGFNISQDFQFTYVSHCTKCTVLQKNQKFVFIRVKQ